MSQERRNDSHEPSLEKKGPSLEERKKESRCGNRRHEFHGVHDPEPRLHACSRLNQPAAMSPRQGATVCDEGILDRRSSDPCAPLWRMNHRGSPRRVLSPLDQGDSCQAAAIRHVVRRVGGGTRPRVKSSPLGEHSDRARATIPPRHWRRHPEHVFFFYRERYRFHETWKLKS